MSDDNIAAGVGAGQGGADVPSPSSADIRSEHIQDRAADTASPRAAEREQSAEPAPKATGRTVRDELRASFAAARKETEARGETFDLAPSTEVPAPSQKSVREHLETNFDQAKVDPDAKPARDARGRWQKKADGTVALGAEPQQPVEPQQPPQDRGHLEGRAPPPGWSAEAKSRWLALPAEVQQAIAQRERDMDNGGRQWSQEKRAYDTVFDPALDAALKNNGMTRVDFAKRAKDWHVALSNANKVQATNHWIEAATNYGIPIPECVYGPDGKPRFYTPPTPEQIAQRARAMGQQPQQQPAQPQPDPRVDQLSRQVEQLSQAQVAQVHQTADALVNEMAAKRYQHDTQQVRDVMAAFLRSGMYPTREGRIDVDALYNKAAAYLDLVPNAAAIAQQQKAEAEAQAARDAAAHRQAHANQAKMAGVSVGTRAPTAAPTPPGGRQRPANQPIPTVADRLREAIREHST